MSEYKISGCCTLCDAPCFEVMQVYEAHERNPGEPKRLGPAMDGAMRVSFMLLDGTKADMTFCGECAANLSAEHYIEIWRKVMRSWRREMSEPYPDWFNRSFANGIAAEMGRATWKEICGA